MLTQETFVIYIKGKTYRTNENYEGYYTDIIRYDGKKLAVITLHPLNAIHFKSAQACLTAVRQLLTECYNIDSITIEKLKNSL